MTQNASLSIRLPEELKAELESMADELGMTLSKVAILVLKEGVRSAREKGMLNETHLIRSSKRNSSIHLADGEEV